MTRLCQITALLFASLVSACAQPAATQDVRVAPFGYRDMSFSRDGKLLRIIGVSLGDLTPREHVRAVTYAVRTGAVVHTVNLAADTNLLSATTDGAKAIVATQASTENGSLFVMDTATGKLQPIPKSWMDPDSDLDAGISGDGRLVSLYSEEESDTPMVVTVYDWATKTVVATRKSAYVSAGGSMDGEVTEDGEVAFGGNRVGSTIVDLKTGRVLAQFGQSSMRSPDGKWEVQFPNLIWDEDAPTDILLKDGMNGTTIGKLDARVPEDEQYGSMSGAFCGASGRFVSNGKHAIAVYALPSGKLLQTLPVETWNDPGLDDAYGVSVACSMDGTRVAILDGTRLTFHTLE